MTSLVRRGARPGVLAVVDQGLVSVANFLTGVLLARGLNQDEFGIYALGLSVVIVAMDLQTSLTSTPYMVFGPQLAGSKRAEYLGSTSVHQLAIGVLVSIVLLVATFGLKLSASNGDLNEAFIILGLVVALILFRDFARRVSFANLEPKIALLLDTAVSILQLVAIVFLLAHDQLTVHAAFIVLGLAAGIPTLGWVLLHRGRINISRHALSSDWQRNWRFGKWVLVSGALWSLSLNAYPWLLATAQGTPATAAWAVGLGVVSIANPLKLGYQNHLGPTIANSFARGSLSDLKGALREGSWKYAAMLMPVTAVLLLFGGKAAEFIYGDDYSELGLLIAIMSFDLLLSAVAYPYSRGLFVINRADLDLKVNLIAVITLATAGVTLVWTSGLVGAAIGLVLANLLATAARVVVFLRHSRVR